MSSTITWLGHSCFLIRTGDRDVLIDPFLSESPVANVKANEVGADFILVTHGHFDHVADAASIAQRTGAVVLANFEIAEWLKGQGVPAENAIGMNTGGGCEQPFGRVTMTIAHHSSSLPDGSYGGTAGGFLLELDGKRVYIAGDTAAFLDMKLIGVGGLDLAVLPIGDLFTMGPGQSIEAIQFLAPRKVLPFHYNTWPPICQDPQAWAETVRQQTAAEPIVLSVGESTDL